MPRSSQDDELLLVPGASFDVRGYTRTAIGSHRDDLDLDGFAAQPLTPSTLRAIRSLERVERSTMHHLRNVLVTPTHKDARVTAFLITWAFEKFWMADALRAVLEAHAIEPLGESSRRGGGAVFDRIRPIGTSLFTGAIGSDIVAVHMALGIADDWAMGATYETVASDAANPTLDAVFARIAHVRARHAEFFEVQARDRLSRSLRSRSLTRARFRVATVPISSSALSADDRRALDTIVQRRATETLARIRTLPGLAGTRLRPGH
ncbi:hypothetical protein [Naasia lichenicola]|uniref:Uncharacterized protein n=1 Tax=Naasia lichenicola TaxID=2565933 RepID=A0A4S4FF68_9MICO|nr:hypothetical protein [Naasia lichenicola]THG28628.1 hypothetical protein E6C64_17680 [Naasia lichenicola]